MTSEGRRRLAPADRRRELLDALSEELVETDWHRISVPMVVRRAGASQGLFYRYFDGLDEAFVALVEQRIVPRLADAGNRLRLDLDTPGDVELSLTAWFESLARLVLDEQHLVRATLVSAPTGSGRAADYCRELLAGLRQWGQSLLEGVNGTGPYRSVDAALVSHMVVGMTVHCALAGLDDTDPCDWAREMARFEAWGLLGRCTGEEENP